MSETKQLQRLCTRNRVDTKAKWTEGLVTSQAPHGDVGVVVCSQTSSCSVFGSAYARNLHVLRVHMSKTGFTTRRQIIRGRCPTSHSKRDVDGKSSEGDPTRRPLSRQEPRNLMIATGSSRFVRIGHRGVRHTSLEARRSPASTHASDSPLHSHAYLPLYSSPRGRLAVCRLD